LGGRESVSGLSSTGKDRSGEQADKRTYPGLVSRQQFAKPNPGQTPRVAAPDSPRGRDDRRNPSMEMPHMTQMEHKTKSTAQGGQVRAPSTRRWWVGKRPRPPLGPKSPPAEPRTRLDGRMSTADHAPASPMPKLCPASRPDALLASGLPRPLPSHSRTPRRPGSAAAPASARLPRTAGSWGRAVCSVCAASRRLGRARCPRPPAPPPGQARRPGPSALSRARPRAPSDPNFVPAPRGWVCWAIGARLGARDEAQRTPTDPGTRRARPGGGLCPANSRTLCASQCCSSRIAFDSHLARAVRLLPRFLLAFPSSPCSFVA